MMKHSAQFPGNGPVLNPHGFPKGRSMMSIRAVIAASALLAAAATATPTRADDLTKLPTTNVLPSGTVKVSGVVPGMGEHWANPKDLPLGPIYCVHKGKVICIEYMISQADFQAGKSWPELTGL